MTSGAGRAYAIRPYRSRPLPAAGFRDGAYVAAYSIRLFGTGIAWWIVALLRAGRMTSERAGTGVCDTPLRVAGRRAALK